ncbi:tripartite tricarboxylate transporter substrate-binding protein [Bradyrhizobium sp. DASA03068]|uniref:tripartite tricarboxylate transporter substrate-binding protein n=1 Tax=Bradyrhizobium sp. BLXBL-01 TaxID=3395915 RepID=UPI003F6F8156
MVARTLAGCPAKDVKAFVADLKAKPGKRNFGSLGSGSSPHVAAKLLKKMTILMPCM